MNFLNFRCILKHEKRGETVNSFKRVSSTANRIRQAMESAGKRQADIVRETGIDKGALSHYLKGRYEPKQDVIYKLAEALNVSEMWLWGYDCEKERITEEKPANDDGLTENQRELLAFATTLSEEQAGKVLQLMKSILAFDE